MRNNLSYPAREHIEQPLTTAEVILDEIRTYPEPSEFRGAVAALAKQYGNTRFMQGMNLAAQAMNYAHVEMGRSPYESGGDPMFFAAAAMAVHSMLRPTSEQTRQQVLFTRPLDQPVWYQDSDEAARWYQGLVPYLTEWRSGRYEEYLIEQTTELQKAVMQLVAHTYGDVPNVGPMEDDFVSGFTFAAYAVEDAASTPYLSEATNRWL
jgi:hypothetical protein